VHDIARREFLRIGIAGAAGLAIGGGAVHAQKQRGSGEKFDIRSFGAKGDGQTIDTPAINKAIEAASASGGTVQVPEGSYLCHSIRLKSNISLYLSEGATIIAAESGAGGGYDEPEASQSNEYQDFGHSYFHNSLIWGEDLSNVSILGPGRIWGRGLSKGAGDNRLAAGVGNKSISLKNCRNVTLRDLSILHGGHFAILATGVDNITVDSLTVDTNRDGIDFDCCSNVRVMNCKVNSPWDDGICLKSSYALGSARPTEHVTIENCYVTAAFEEGTFLDGTRKPIGPDYDAPRIGRIKCGTESNGGFRNITITNCVFEGCRGLALETVDGGTLENIEVSNIKMRDIQDVPFFLRLGARMRGPKGGSVGQFRRVSISNVEVSNADSRQCSIISGIPDHKIEDVKFSNIHIEHRGGGNSADAAIDPPEKEKAYPEPIRLGPMPAHGFFIRHAKGIEMRDIQIQAEQQDSRPAFVLRDVEKVNFTHVELPSGNQSAWWLKNVKDFRVTQSRPTADVHLDKVKEKTL
jgi:polygalacturonase